MDKAKFPLPRYLPRFEVSQLCLESSTQGGVCESVLTWSGSLRMHQDLTAEKTRCLFLERGFAEHFNVCSWSNDFLDFKFIAA